MRSVIVFILVLMAAATCMAQTPYIPIVQSQTNVVNSSSLTCAFPKSVTSGNLLLAVASWEGSTNTPTVTDTLSTSYTQKAISTANSVKVAAYAGTASSSGSDTVTFAVTSGTYMNFTCLEILPYWTLTVDNVGWYNYSGTPASPINVANVTTTMNGDLVITYVGDYNSLGWQTLNATSTSPAWQIGFGAASSQDAAAAFLSVAGTSGTFTGLKLDSGGQNPTAMTLALKPSSIAITSTALPDGSLSNSYSYQLLALGGSGAYTWSITSGSLQSGLSLNSSTGVISGTPTVSSQNSLTVQVTDGTNTTTKSLSLKIGASANTISYVQGKFFGNTNTLTFTSNVTAGNLLVVTQGYYEPRDVVAPCTDSLGTQFYLVGFQAYGIVGSYSNGYTSILAGIAPSSGADTVACDKVDQIAEFHNAQLFGDSTVGNFGTTATPATITSSSLTTLTPNALIVGSCGGFTSLTAMSVVSPLADAGGGSSSQTRLGYHIPSSVSGYTEQCSYINNTTGAWVFDLVSFRPTVTAVSAVTGIKHKSYLF